MQIICLYELGIPLFINTIPVPFLKIPPTQTVRIWIMILNPLDNSSWLQVKRARILLSQPQTDFNIVIKKRHAGDKLLLGRASCSY